MIKKETCPVELAALPQWVCWRLERDERHNWDAKVPYCPSTGRKDSASNPVTWSTLEEALFYRDNSDIKGVAYSMVIRITATTHVESIIIMTYCGLEEK